jgi:hypothetical protein
MTTSYSQKLLRDRNSFLPEKKLIAIFKKEKNPQYRFNFNLKNLWDISFKKWVGKSRNESEKSDTVILYIKGRQLREVDYRV